MDEIVNRIANSSLVTIDLEDYYPSEERVSFDIKDWLFEELILKEKDFRNYVDDYDWSQLQHKYVALHCSVDAIIPSWAYMLIASKVAPFAKKVITGDLLTLDNILFTEIINTFDISQFLDKPVIIKGCADKPIPESAYTLLVARLTNVARSIMFGEACSTVPLFKKTK